VGVVLGDLGGVVVWVVVVVWVGVQGLGGVLGLQGVLHAAVVRRAVILALLVWDLGLLNALIMRCYTTGVLQVGILRTLGDRVGVGVGVGVGMRQEMHLGHRYPMEYRSSQCLAMQQQ